MSIYSSYLNHVVFRERPLDENWINHALSLDLPQQLSLLREEYHRDRIVQEKTSSRAKKRAISLSRILPRNLSPKVYLDFGGADGQITAHLASILRTRRAICADLTQWQNMHHNESRDDRVEFLPLDSSVIPLSDNSVDFCTALQVLHHVPDQEKSITELHRVIKSGGYLLIREHDCISQEIATRIDWVHYLYEIVVADEPNWEYLEHKAEYHSLVEWRKIIKGFRLVRMEKARDDDIHRNCHLLFQKV